MTKTVKQQQEAIALSQARRREALRLREEEAKSLSEIGTIMGVSRQRADQMVKQAAEERDNA